MPASRADSEPDYTAASLMSAMFVSLDDIFFPYGQLLGMPRRHGADNQQSSGHDQQDKPLHGRSFQRKTRSHEIQEKTHLSLLLYISGLSVLDVTANFDFFSTSSFRKEEHGNLKAYERNCAERSRGVSVRMDYDARNKGGQLVCRLIAPMTLAEEV